MMEVYEASDHYIIQEGDYGLWCNRITGKIVAKPGVDLCEAWNPICIGVVYGVIGKVKILPDSEWRLMLIKQRNLVGQTLHGADVYRVHKVVLLPLSMKGLPAEFELVKCENHHFGIRKPKQITQQGKQMLQSTWNSLQKVKDSVQSKKNGKDPQKEYERLERRISEELVKMFNISDFYYYSPNGDITNSVQRQNLPTYNKADPLWKRADERFFWNRSLLNDLIDSGEALADHWIQPIIQGFFDVKKCNMLESNHYHSSQFHENVFEFTVALLSRRSRHRAGTRYKRRGVDVEGDCANYVETEQIVNFQAHTVSYVQVRGSIPVYWSQPGHKYRPPPVLDKGETETLQAFSKHFEQQISHYKNVTCISLVDRVGREKTMADAFLHHVVLYNNPAVAYVAFDFHEYCRGMQFDNVVMLTDAIKDFMKNHKYCWVDGEGMICEQNGVFRVNCIDCLDRTNVVQTAVARLIIDQQVRKLGLLTPDEELPDTVRHVFNQLWANNGDAISRQYAGTAAMKGDYTRTGERKFSGLMKDGVKSANRYLIHRFKDMYRQAAINIQLGKPLEPDVLTLLTREQQTAENQQDEIDYIRDKAGDVVSVIEEGRTLLIIEPEQSLGGWAVISLDEKQDMSAQDNEMDTILLLTNAYYYVVTYDDELDCLTDYQKISVTDLYAIDIGPESTSIFKSKFQCIRLWYKYYGEAGYFHTFRVPNVRAFNNAIIEIKNAEEEMEILRAIADTVKVACELAKGLVNIREVRVENKKFRCVPKRSIQSTSIETNIWTQPQKIASLASSAVNKAASSVRKQVTNQLRRISRSPSSSTNRGQPGYENHSMAEEGDDFGSVSDTDASEHTVDGVDSNGTIGKAIAQRPAPPPRIIRTRTMSVGSMPDLSVTTDEGFANEHLLSVQTPEDLRHSAPYICSNSDINIPQSVADTVHHENIEHHENIKQLKSQSHHSTAPNLQSLAVKSEALEIEEEHYANVEPLSSPQMKLSFSDDGLKQYAVKLPQSSRPGPNRSPFSKLRSGLSQVSQLIVNQNSSPHTRRRKQVLEAQLLDNSMTSRTRFKNLETKILLL